MHDHVAVGVYSDRSDVEATIQRLAKVNISMARISVVGCDGQALESLLERCSAPEPGALSPETWLGDLPGLGPFAVVGLQARLLGGVVLADASGDIVGQMTFADIAADYLHWLKAGHILVIIHCTAAEEPGVLKILEACQSQNPRSYQFAGADAVSFTSD